MISKFKISLHVSPSTPSTESVEFFYDGHGDKLFFPPCAHHVTNDNWNRWLNSENFPKNLTKCWKVAFRKSTSTRAHARSEGKFNTFHSVVVRFRVYRASERSPCSKMDSQGVHHSCPPLFFKPSSSIYRSHCNSDRTVSLVASSYVPGMSNSIYKTGWETPTVPGLTYRQHVSSTSTSPSSSSSSSSSSWSSTQPRYYGGHMDRRK